MLTAHTSTPGTQGLVPEALADLGALLSAAITAAAPVAA